MTGFNSKKDSVAQHAIKTKIRRYLKRKHYSKRIRKNFKDGYCHGLAVLAGYGQYISSQPRSKTPCDNWEWFEQTASKIAGWDGHLSSLSPLDQAEIERFISLIQFFQHVSDYLPYGQGSLDDYLTDTNNRTLKQEFTFAGLLTTSDFTKPLHLGTSCRVTTLINEILKYDQRIILVSCGRHTLSLFRDGDKISLYDSNHDKGRQLFKRQHPEALIQALFRAYHYDLDKPSPIGFRLFTFEPTLSQYANPQQILDQLQTPLVYDYAGNKKGYSALHIASRVGSTECIRHFLAQGADLATEDNKGQTPHSIAKSRHFTHIAEILQPPRHTIGNESFTAQHARFFSPSNSKKDSDPAEEQSESNRSR